MRIVKDTPFEFGHAVWQVRPPHPSLTVVVKGTFDLVPGAATAALASKQRPCHGEVYFDDDPTQSLQFDSDLAVYKPRGECFVAGSCHAPGGVAVTTSAVAFSVGPVRKSLGVIGDRRWTGFGGHGDITPFTAMPLRWERSFGGADFAANPVGVGIGTSLPNLEDPSNLVKSPSSRPAPAGFFPIPKSWAARMRRVGTYEGAWLSTRWPWFPADFDWEFFNAAPNDQRINGFWQGDERITLQGMHPDHPRIETRLPGLRARAFVDISRGEQRTFEEVPLRLDTVSIDGDGLQVSALWRGLIEVASERLDDVAALFYFHEPLDVYASMDEAWTRYAGALAREGDEVRDLDIIPPSDDDLPEEVPAPPEPPNTLSTDVIARVGPAFAAAGLGAAALQKLFTAAPPPPERPPSAAGVKAALTEAGEDVPPEIARAAPEAEAALEPEPEAVPEAEAALTREDVIARHAAGEPFADLDLTGLDLGELDLRGADFQKVILTRADLRRCDLRGANFAGATLPEATLTGADLRDTNFTEADVAEVDAEGANAERAVFDGATGDNSRWVNARFDHASMQRADFSGADLSGSTFLQANLAGSEFQSARLARCDFSEATLDEASFERAQCPESRFVGASMAKFRASEQADFRRSTFERARAPESAWARSCLDECDFTRAVLTRADLAESRLVTARFHGADASRARFDNAAMTGASLLEANCHEGNFEGAELAHADLRGANLFGAQLWRAHVHETRTELANLDRTHLEGTSWQKA